MGFSIWWRYRTQWGALKQFEGTVHGAHGKLLQIAGKTQHLDIQWGEAHGRASFIVILGLESPPCLIGMDIMRPLRVHIDVTNGTATPAQPDPQTVHLNAAQSQQRRQEKPLPGTGLHSPQGVHLQLRHHRVGSHYPRLAHQPWGPHLHPKFPSHGKKLRCRELNSRLREPLILPGNAVTWSERKCRYLEPGYQLLPSQRFLTQPPLPPANSHQVLHCQLPHRAPLAAFGCCKQQIPPPPPPPETARLVRCHNPWPAEDVLFCPNDALPAFVTGIPAFSSGPELWIAVHNHRPEPFQLHSGQNIGVLEVVTLADSPATASPASSHPETLCHPPLPERLSLLQQQQLNELSVSLPMYSAEGKMISGILRCWSMRSRPMGLRFASPITGRTPQFAERRWHKCSKCCPAMSSAPRTAHGPLQS